VGERLQLALLIREREPDHSEREQLDPIGRPEWQL